VISDEETLREFEFLEIAAEFAKNERLWRRRTDYKAAERAQAAEEKLVKMFLEPAWASREVMVRCYNQYRLRLLYKHQPEA
jgi:hypothetical protein